MNALNDTQHRSLLFRAHNQFPPQFSSTALERNNWQGSLNIESSRSSACVRDSLASSNSHSNSSHSSLSLGPSLSSISLLSLPILQASNETPVTSSDNTSLVLLRRSRAGSHKNMNYTKSTQKALQYQLTLLEKQLLVKMDELERLDSMEKVCQYFV